MARTPGQNALARIEVAGETWYFPVPYTEAMKAKSLTDAQIVTVQERWVEKMKAAGFTAEMVKQQKASIVTSGVNIFGEALSEALSKPTPAASASTAAVTAPTSGKFETNATKWYGLDRLLGSDRHPRAPKLPFIFVDGDAGMVERARIFASAIRPLLYVGEAGVGKTAEVYHFADELGYGAIRFGHDAHTEVEDILGKQVKRPDGRIEYEYGPLAIAVRDGLVYIADEINALKAGPLMVYQAINERDTDLILTNNNGEVIPRHPNFRWVGTMNPTHYAGTNELSLAQLGRPFVFNVDYPDEAKEAKILATNFKGLDRNIIKTLVRFANEVRARKRKDPENVLYSVGTRDLVKIAELITEVEIPVRRAVEICVLNVVSNLGDKTETDAIQSLVNTRF